MAINKQGKQSFIFNNRPKIAAWASVAGKKESEGPLNNYFDITSTDNYFTQPTWEQAERHMQELALNKLIEKANIQASAVDVVFSGDLLNQRIGSSFSLRNMQIPHFGLYGACSTMAEGLILASMTVNAEYVDHAVAITSSHFSASERQYRFPLDYGGQRTPTAQWTVTGAGAALITLHGKGPEIVGCTVGTITDFGIKDTNNMGAAMAPAAFETIQTHFKDFNTDASDYDLIVTGDLGELGKNLLLTLAQKAGLSLAGKLCDCGTMVFDLLKQDVHSGGSGCGCSAITLCGYLLQQLKERKLRKILFCGTGALLSPTSAQQGLTIPGVCHAVTIVGG